MKNDLIASSRGLLRRIVWLGLLMALIGGWSSARAQQAVASATLSGVAEDANGAAIS